MYRLAIEGGHGDRVRNDEPWRINVLWDTPPKVRIHGHNGGEVIRSGNETVRFDLSAVDDVRLAVNGRKPVYFYNRMGGNVPTVEEVFEAVKERFGATADATA